MERRILERGTQIPPTMRKTLDCFSKYETDFKKEYMTSNPLLKIRKRNRIIIRQYNLEETLNFLATKGALYETYTTEAPHRSFTEILLMNSAIQTQNFIRTYTQQWKFTETIQTRHKIVHQNIPKTT